MKSVPDLIVTFDRQASLEKLHAVVADMVSLNEYGSREVPISFMVGRRRYTEVVTVSRTNTDEATP